MRYAGSVQLSGSLKLKSTLRDTATLALGTTTEPTGTLMSAPQDPSLWRLCTSDVTLQNFNARPYLITAMSPLMHSRTSRIKKSIFGLPIPMLTIDTGAPLYRPVMVKNPRSEDNLNGCGESSSNFAMVSARDGEPTVT